jgi:hypothetical protein
MADSAARSGVDIDATVEREALGDGPSHECKFSHKGEQLTMWNPRLAAALVQAQAEHREKAIADTYTVLVRPAIDLIAESIRS